MPGTVEHVVLSSGRALIGPTSDPVELHPGDYIAYPGDLPHVFKALTKDTSAVLISETS
jgi:quercetin dioxygenase-like cupin family protein